MGNSSYYWRCLARATMEEHLGRKLSTEEIVHHGDGDITNNNLDNLRLMSRSEHMKLHRPDIGKNNRGRKGQPLLQETRDKISKALTGRIVSQETKNKVSEARLGSKHSQKAKDKVSKANTGRVRSVETKAKMRRARRLYLERRGRCM